MANCLILKKVLKCNDADLKKIDKLIEAVKEFPMENTETDRENLLSRLRAKYREARQSFPSLPLLPYDNASTKVLEF